MGVCRSDGGFICGDLHHLRHTISQELLVLGLGLDLVVSSRLSQKNILARADTYVFIVFCGRRFLASLVEFTYRITLLLDKAGRLE